MARKKKNNKFTTISIKWEDKDLGIMWPFYEHWGYSEPVLSEKDKKGLSFKDCEKYE